MVKRMVKRIVGTALLCAALVLGLGTPALATFTEDGPAAAPGGVSDTFTVKAVVASAPYAPDVNIIDGPAHCALIYHHYEATPGCGGFEITEVLHHVKEQPGWAGNAGDRGYVYASADTARTFGCRDAAGNFDWGTAFVVGETQRDVPANYLFNDLGYLWSIYRGADAPSDVTTKFYVNFLPVDFSCPAGMTKAQFGLKISNVRIWTVNSVVLGTTTWSHAGPFYG